MRRVFQTARLALLALLIPTGCADESSAPLIELVVDILEPADGTALREGDLVRLEAVVDTTGSEFDLSETVVIWSSDVVGVLSSAEGGCESDTCWISEAVTAGETVWPMVTRLPPGSHVITARALDLKGGRVEPATATVVVVVDDIVAPEIHLVAPEEGTVLVTGSDFTLEAWISDDSDGDVDVGWSSSVHGLVHESTVGAPGTYRVDCHAGGVATSDDPCHLSPGTHVMVLVASDLDDDGGTSHSFLTLHVVGPSADEGS